MSRLSSYDTTAANNADPPPFGAPEGMDYRLVNDVLRRLMSDMAHLYAERSQLNPTQVGGLLDYSVLWPTFAGNIFAVADVLFKAFAANPAGVGVRPLGLAAGSSPLLDEQGTALHGGQIRAGDLVRVFWDTYVPQAQVLSGNNVDTMPLLNVNAVTGTLTLPRTYIGSMLINNTNSDRLNIPAVGLPIGSWFMMAKSDTGVGGVFTLGFQTGAADALIRWADGSVTEAGETRSLTDGETAVLYKVEAKGSAYPSEVWVGMVFS